MKRLLVAGVLLLGLVSALSSGGKHRTQTTEASTPLGESSPTATVSHARHVASHHAPASLTQCDPNISVNAHASCGFAESVFRAYAQALHGGANDELEHTVEARSPVTGRTYTMSCHGQGGATSTTICTGASDAAVKFPVLAAQEYETPSTRSESRPEGESADGDEGSEGGSGEEDEVGSTSHATDAQFCSEHECIGSFTSEGGAIVECSDGSYSHAGGISGACSDHGGESG